MIEDIIVDIAWGKLGSKVNNYGAYLTLFAQSPSMTVFVRIAMAMIQQDQADRNRA